MRGSADEVPSFKLAKAKSSGTLKPKDEKPAEKDKKPVEKLLESPQVPLAPLTRELVANGLIDGTFRAAI